MENMSSLFSKNKTKKSSESPKDGQKEAKMPRITSPPKQLSEAEQNDIVGSLCIIMEEIKEVKAGQAKMTEEITKLIDSKISDLRSELKTEINTKIDHSEMYLRMSITEQ